MPHNPHKCDSKGLKAPVSNLPERSQPLPGLRIGHGAHNSQHDNTQAPFNDDTNHVAYGWQQMATLPDVPGLHTLVRGMQDGPSPGPEIRQQTWLFEQQQATKKVERNGFNPYPKRKGGPRRPPPLIQPEDEDEHRHGIRRRLRPFADAHSIHREGEGTGTIAHSDRPARLTLVSKDKNQKLQNGQSQESASTFLSLTDNLCKMERQPQRKRLIIDEPKSPQPPDKQIERMTSLTEEPAPLQVRKNRADRGGIETHPRSTSLDQAHMLHAEQGSRPDVQLAVGTNYVKSQAEKPGSDDLAHSDSSRGREGMTVTVREVSETIGEEMECLMTAITEELSAITLRRPRNFEHRSAIPRPLDMDAIKAARRKRELPKFRSKSNIISDRGERDRFYGIKVEFIEPLATATSPKLEVLSAPGIPEHNGTKRKWYKGFRRSGW